MEIIYSIFAGIIQGLTEFLPISSSGHLVIWHELWTINLPSELLFDVVLHLGTLLALIVFFAKDLSKYSIAFFQSFGQWQFKKNINQRLAWLLIIGTVPAVIIGYFLEDIIASSFRQPYWVAVSLVVIAIFFILVEKIATQKKDLPGISVKNSLIIGFAQAIALIPGVSRSGITISAGLLSGLNRAVAARFSFLLSIPIVLGAGLKKLFDLSSLNLAGLDWLILVVGFVASVLTGYFCIKYFLKYLQKNTLKPFAVYRFILAAAIIGYFYLLK